MLTDALLVIAQPLLAVAEPYYSRVADVLRQPKTHRFVLKALVFAALFAALFVVAVLLYAAMYLLYVPARGAQVDLHFRYAPGLAPTAHVPLSNHNPFKQVDFSAAAAAASSSSASAATAAGASSSMSFSPLAIMSLPSMLLSSLGMVAAAATAPSATLFVPHQPYSMQLQMRVPESQANVDLANFMAAVTLYSPTHEPLYFATRPASLKYRSPLLSWMSTLVYGVPLLTGYMTESQSVSVQLIESVVSPPAFADPSYKAMLSQWSYFAWQSPSTVAHPPAFLDTASTLASNNAQPAVDIAYAVVTLSAPIQTYKTTLHITAQFHGLRYVMYHWFFTSAAIGVGVLMVWEVVLGLAFWRIFIGRRVAVLIGGPEDDDENDIEEEEEEEEEETDDVSAEDTEQTEGGGETATEQGETTEASASTDATEKPPATARPSRPIPDSTAAADAADPVATSTAINTTASQ
ncbi:Berardinelli-Seip congenital lipodystrophy 2 (seipin) [Sorochytrium milnesiophthora]